MSRKEERARERRSRKRKLNAKQLELLRALAVLQDADHEDTMFLLETKLVDGQWEGPPTLNKDGREFLKSIDSEVVSPLRWRYEDLSQNHHHCDNPDGRPEF